MVGGGGSLEHRLKTMVRDFEISESVKFLGHIPEEDLPNLYQAADFFVLPTKKLEGFGLVIPEAMACGTPVLGTPVGAIPEVVGGFEKRLLFDGTEWPHLMEKMEEVVESSDKYRFDPEDCRTYIKNNFSWEKVAHDFEHEAAELLAS